MKKVFVSVLTPQQKGEREQHDFTNGGISSMYNYMYLFHECTPEEAIKECERTGENIDRCLILDRTGCGHEYLHCYPLIKHKEGMIGPMFGGNYINICGSDPNYPTPAKLNEHFPIPIHDRYETPEAYKHLSI